MIQTLQTRRAPRLLAMAVAALLVGPVLAGCGRSDNNAAGNGGTTVTTAAPPPAPMRPAAKPGMSTGKKAVIALAGAALLYYLYKKHQAAQEASGAAGASGQRPQLYRSKNGGIYYRDPQDPQKVVWVTAPAQPVQVPADEVRRYAPDYSQYQGQDAPPVPSGARTQSAYDYDPSLNG